MKIKTRKCAASGKTKRKTKNSRPVLKGWPKDLSRLMEVRPFASLKEGLVRALTRI